MPRIKRSKSYTKVYHIIIRGINKQDIFLDKQDYLKFIKEIENTKEKYLYEIYAYSFMNDHIHFVVYDKNDNISIAIQSLNIRYSSYFNKKYERIGHLFQNRFKSKNIEDEMYLKNVIRYIHKNPENAGMEPYIWTSYKEYFYKNKIITAEKVLKLFGNNMIESINNFKEYHKLYNKKDDNIGDYELLRKISDEEAIETIKNILNEDNLLKIQKYEKNKKYNAILKLLKIDGITKEQLSRILGISTRTIKRIEDTKNI